MVNIDALLSPTGGSLNGDRLNGGFNGLLNFGITLGVDRLLSGQATQSYLRSKAVSLFNKTPAGQRLTANITKLNSKISRVQRATSNRLTKQSSGIFAAQTASRATIHEKFDPDTGYSSRQTLINQIRSDIKNQKTFFGKTRRIESAFKSAGKIFSGLAWGLAVEWAASSAFDIMSPKISATANRSNEELFTQSRADSAAAYTQRQRAMMAIVDSQSSINNVVGSEAMHFHK